MKIPIGKRIFLPRQHAKRLFLAIPLPPQWQEALVGIQQELQKREVTGPIKTRWTPRGNAHITALFIGNVAQKLVPHTLVFLKQYFGKTKQFTLLFDHVEIALPGDPKMVWITYKCTQDFEHLVASLRRSTRKFFHDVGAGILLYRDHEAIPHVTLARVNGDTKARGIIPIHTNVPEVLLVTSLVLYSSETKPEGSVYHKIATFHLHK